MTGNRFIVFNGKILYSFHMSLNDSQLLKNKYIKFYDLYYFIQLFFSFERLSAILSGEKIKIMFTYLIRFLMLTVLNITLLLELSVCFHTFKSESIKNLNQHLWIVLWK